MAEQAVTFQRSIGEPVTVVATSQPGRIDGLYVGKDGVSQYLIAPTGPDATASDATWLRSEQLADWVDPPAEAPTVTPLEFLHLLTPAELDAALASDNPLLKKAILFIQASPAIKLDGAEMVQGLGLMKQLGILSAARATRIASGEQPE